MVFYEKIVYVIENINTTGGIRTILLEKAKLFSKIGYNVSIISINMIDNLAISDSLHNINLFNLNLKRSDFSKKEYLSTLKIKLENQFKFISATHAFFLIDNGLNIYPDIRTSARKIIEIHGSYGSIIIIPEKTLFIKKDN